MSTPGGILQTSSEVGISEGPVQARLAHYLESQLSRPVEYVGRAPGNSHDGFIFSVTGEDRKLLVRLDPDQGPFLHYDGANEALLMRQLAASGMPVPEVIAAGDESVFGTPFLVLDWIEGEVHNPRQTSDFDESRRVVMAREMAEVLSRLHALSLDEVSAPGELGTAHGDPATFLLQFDKTLDQLAVVSSRVLDFVRLWLHSHLGDTREEVTLVHGDFRLANLVWQEDRVAGILDWETARFGNPLFDVGWMCMSARSGDDPIMGLVSRDQFVELYNAASGRRMDERDVLLWQIAAAWVRGCTELRLLDLALQSEDPALIDVRDLSWQFGSHRTDAELLRLIEQFEAL